MAPEPTTAIVYDGTEGTRVRTADVIVVGCSAETLLAAVTAAVASGARRVELCGGFALARIAEVAGSLPATVSLTANRYAYDQVEALASFRRAEREGSALPFACLFPVEGDEEVRVEHSDGVFVGIPHASWVTSVVGALPPERFGLIELYGGFDSRDAVEAAQASNGVPVGFTDPRSSATISPSGTPIPITSDRDRDSQG